MTPMSPESLRRILITGGCGFIGKHLALRLRDLGHEVRVLDILSPQVHGPSPDLSWMLEHDVGLVRGSVTDPQACDEALESVGGVFHLAAETGTGQSMYELGRYMDTNVTGTAVLLEACIRRGVRCLVLSSSRAVYGEGSWLCAACGPVHPALRAMPEPGEAPQWSPLCPMCGQPVASALPTQESESAQPVSVYGISKLAQEQLVGLCGRAFGLSYSILRFFNVFGPGQALQNPYTGVLAVFVNRARLGRPLDLYEDGKILRDFVFVEDVVKALILAMEKGEPGPLNIGSGRAVTIEEIAHMIMALAGSSSSLQVTGRMRFGDVRGLVADIGQAASTLGWSPATSFEEGLKAFVDWAAQSPAEDSYEGSLAELKARGLYQ